MTTINCPICGIEKTDDTFYWSHKPQGVPNATTPDAVYSKICAVAKQCGKDTSGCINKEGKFDINKSWVDFEDLNQLIIKNSL